MVLNDIICNYDGISIKVINSFTNAKLFVDGKLLDQSNSLIAPIFKSLVLKVVNFPFKSGPKTIQVYCRGLFTVKFMVCVDDEHIGGEKI